MSTTRIVSWNMGYAFPAHGYRKYHSRAWAVLTDELKFDVALLQEVEMGRLDSLCERGLAVRVPTSEGSVTGTAIVCREGRLSELARTCDDDAAVAAAAYESAHGEHLIVVSAHVVTGRGQQSALRRIVDWTDERVKGHRFVVGGDFNASRCWNAYQWFFDALAARGFRDCHFERHTQEKRSYWGKDPTVVTEKPIQDDHVFVDARTFEELDEVGIRDEATFWELSDHGPVVLDFSSR